MPYLKIKYVPKCMLINMDLSFVNLVYVFNLLSVSISTSDINCMFISICFDREGMPAVPDSLSGRFSHSCHLWGTYG
jgi:hypothetical protein